MGKIRTGAYNPLPVVPMVLVGANVKGNHNLDKPEPNRF
jgi:hypothetical protein